MQALYGLVNRESMMADSSSDTLDTYLQHVATAEFDPNTGSAAVPLPSVRASTVRFRTVEDLDAVVQRKRAGERVQTYGRAGLDTHAALESVFCRLEGADFAYLAPSGMAAISLVFLALLKSGDEVLVADCAYAPVRRLDDAVLSRMGIGVRYAPGNPTSLAEHLNSNTRMLYVESPGSLLLEMLDVPALAAFAREHGLILVADNTWGTGGVYYPLALGVDVSVVAGTKYVGGHSDLMLGAVMVNDATLARHLDTTHYALGYALSADDAWLAIRGARTLPLRLERSARNGLALASWLQQHPLVEQVYHPALPQDPGHALWKRDCHGSNGLVSARLKMDVPAARRLVNALQLFGIGFSWGGFESLVQLVSPDMLAPHSYWQAASGPVIRLYAGLESSQDLIADLEQALAQARP